MITQADFIAILKYRTAEDGGRQTAAGTNIRPAIKFPFSEYMTSGQQTFINKELVYPGETVEAEIRILSVHIFKNSLEEGMEFEFREGPRITGIGTITKIVNENLRKTN